MIKFKFNVGQFNNAIELTRPAMTARKVGSEEVKSYFYFNIVRDDKNEKIGYCLFLAGNPFTELSSYMEITNIVIEDEEKVVEEMIFFVSAKDCLNIANAVSGMKEEATLEIRNKAITFKCKGFKLLIEQTPDKLSKTDEKSEEPISEIKIKKENLEQFKKYLSKAGTMNATAEGDLGYNVFLGIDKTKRIDIVSTDGHIVSIGEFEKIESIKQEQDYHQILIPGNDFKAFFKYAENYGTDLEIFIFTDRVVFVNNVLNIANIKTVDGVYFYHSMKKFSSRDIKRIKMKVDKSELLRAFDMIEVHAGTQKAYMECTLKGGRWLLNAAKKKSQCELTVEADGNVPTLALNETLLRKIVKRIDDKELFISFIESDHNQPIMIHSEKEGNIRYVLALVNPNKAKAEENKKK